MEKTIFKLNYKYSVIICSIIAIIMGFLSNVFYVHGFGKYLLFLLRCFAFFALFFILYKLEKNNEFKEYSKRVCGLLLLACIVNSICGLFASFNLLANFFISISGIMCLFFIVFMIIEILRLYFKNELLDKIVGLSNITNKIFYKILR